MSYQVDGTSGLNQSTDISSVTLRTGVTVRAIAEFDQIGHLRDTQHTETSVTTQSTVSPDQYETHKLVVFTCSEMEQVSTATGRLQAVQSFKLQLKPANPADWLSFAEEIFTVMNTAATAASTMTTSLTAAR